MKQLCILAFLSLSLVGLSQSQYQKGMTKAFELWTANEDEQAENLFERIANAEPNNWVPLYYVAQMNILKSWTEKDETVLKAQMDKAMEYLSKASKLSPNNAELTILEAQCYTVWIAFDGMTYGMKYSAKIAELYKKALALEGDNPRVILGKAEWDMGSASYFGQDTAPYCSDVKKAIALFDTYEIKGQFYPNWGKKHAQDVLNSCNQ